MTTTTNSNLYTLMEERKSVRVYDPNFKIAKEEIEEMIKLATSAPSSSNLQPWRFIVIQDEQVKKELRVFDSNKAKTEQASAIIAVLGNHEMHEKVEQIYTQNVTEGHMGEDIKNATIAGTLASYPNIPKEARMNIASFDAGLISMQLMLIAKDKGYDTVTMGGFDKADFAERFKLEDNLFPIVLIAIGKAAAPAFGSSRLPMDEIVSFI